MFDLNDVNIAELSVLDCCAGSSSFVAELTARGGHGIAVDPAYSQPLAELVKATRDGNAGADEIICNHGSRFTWRWYGSPERRQTMRRRSARRFAADYAENPHHYVAGALPHLPFADGTFDLGLCSHLLFTWSELYDADWHYAALTELLRISREQVRVFPLVVQGSGKRAQFVDDVVSRLVKDGYTAHLRRVPYEFQRGADTMLLVSRRATSP